jgi:hypothetical protein
MNSMIRFFYTQGKIKRLPQNIKISENDLRIKHMNKTTLSMTLIYCGLITPHLCLCPPTIDITFYLLKFKNTICILHHLAIDTIHICIMH